MKLSNNVRRGASVVTLALSLAPACAYAQSVSNEPRVVALSGNVAPRWGKVRSFWGDSTPYWGKVRGFWGDVGPYSGDVTGFWGKIRGFGDGTAATNFVAPSDQIEAFWGDVGASWGKVRSFWDGVGSYGDNKDGYGSLAQQIKGITDESRDFWGNAVQAQSGKSFDEAITRPLFAKYGIDLDNPQSLEALDTDAREHFFLDWHDAVMSYSNADQVDHWMKEVNWTPGLTQVLGFGSSTVIGLLDFSVTGEAANNVVKYGGVSNVANGHGAAVASLMVDPMDGKGVMGIAPEASVIAYNPFDATQTAGWSDIKNGIQMLASNKASVINMSLGVPGWTLNSGWNTIFIDKAIQPITTRSIFVIAAGNDGVSQTQSIMWGDHNPSFIVVGSVDPNGNISNFSNQPGTACLLENDGRCKGDMLMNHFMVAPGEMMLVSDGMGGVTRMSGTSFAAPLVSGTIALIQDRWPWLTGKPADVTNIILKSADDLGAPGIDPVYGVGKLDVLAALSPLDWNKLTFKISTNGKISDITANGLRATSAAQRATWEANNVYISAFEKTLSSQRDFEIPLSSKLANQTVGVQGAQEQFMGYLSSRFSSWLGAPIKLADGTVRQSFTDLNPATAQLPAMGKIRASLSMRMRPRTYGFVQGAVPIDSTLHLNTENERVAFDFGNGQSGPTIGGQMGFGMSSDYDVYQGGANPFLGFASGGSFAHVELRLTPRLTVSSGVTERKLKMDLDQMPVGAAEAFRTLAPYSASAFNVTAKYKLTPTLEANFGYTQLHEDHAVLGMESISPGDLSGGSTTDAATIGLGWNATPTVSLAASGTFGRTRSSKDDAGIAINGAGLISTAFQFVVSKQKLFGSYDHLRITFAQPLHVEGGSLSVSSVAVVDRTTGELGAVRQLAKVSGAPRRYVAELMYGTPLRGGHTELRLFGRANLGDLSNGQYPAWMGGASVNLSF